MKRKREAGLLHQKRSQLGLLDLPTDILINIISRLPIRDAIRTSILSSRWRYLWRDHADLTFDISEFTGKGKSYDVPGFLAKVDAVLEQHNGVGVNALYVHCAFLRKTHADHIDKWVKFVVESRAKELSLHLSKGYERVTREQAYNFPCHLFNNGSDLRCLLLTSVSLNPDNVNGFLNLRELSMVDVSITGEHLEHLLCSCTLLEVVEIVSCRTLISIRASHANSSTNRLKHLVVHGCDSLKRIEMNNYGQLTTLYYSGPVEIPLQFDTVSRLRLEVSITGKNRRKTDVLDYAYLLDAAPFLEKLELHMWMTADYRPYRAENYGELRSLAPGSHKRHTHLQSVYFSGFFGYKDQVELALHILHSSAVLQSMKIDPEVKLIRSTYPLPEYYEAFVYDEARMAATEFACKADRNNVVEVVEGSPLYPAEFLAEIRKEREHWIGSPFK